MATNKPNSKARLHFFYQHYGPVWLSLLSIVFSCLLIAGPAHSQSAGGATATGNAPSYSALADLLENKSSRDQLIEQLRTLAAKPAAAQQGSAAEATDKNKKASGAPQAFIASTSSRIIDTIQQFAVNLSSDLAQIAQSIRNLGRGDGDQRITRQLSVLLGFAGVIAATIIAFLIFRVLASLFYTRLNAWVARVPSTPASTPGRTGKLRPGIGNLASVGLYRKLGAAFGALVIDACAILLAAGVGYLVVLFAVAHHELVSRLGSLFINAFVAVEVARALVRVVFATRYPHLRLMSMADDIAYYWNGWLARLISITGYGLLVAVPAAKFLLLPAVGQLLGLFIMLGVYVYAVGVIWTNRVLLRQRLIHRADASSTAFFSTLIRILARVWHVLAIAYFTVLLVVSQVEPQDALPFMARATLQTLFAVGLGLLLSTILSGLLSQRIRLSEELRNRLPLLEARINSYVPMALKFVRLLILFIVALVVLDAWRAFSLSIWLASSGGRETIAAVVHVAIILLIAALVWTVLASVIEHRLSAESSHKKPSEREKTLLSLFRNAALIVIITMTILVVLSQIGIDIGPLIAGAGVVGLAIGFGAQKLVQDVITGVFIQLENGMNQNDVVELCGLFGTVEKITIRSVVIRTLDGGYHLIPFSSVDKLTNHMRDFGYHYGEYNIGHRENVDNAIYHLERAFDELMQDTEIAPAIIEKMSIPGVTSLTEKGFTIRVLIKTMPGMQWAVQRAFNRLVKKHFDAAGIELPYPHSVVHFDQDKNGYAAQLNVHPASAATSVDEDYTSTPAAKPSEAARLDNSKAPSASPDDVGDEADDPETHRQPDAPGGG